MYWCPNVGTSARHRSGSRSSRGSTPPTCTLLAAGAVIVATPVVIVYVFSLQRHFIRGMLTGAVKGPYGEPSRSSRYEAVRRDDRGR